MIRAGPPRERPGDDREASEAALVERAREGNPEALHTLFVRYDGLLRDRIRRWMTAGLRRKTSAADVLQEAYVVALRRVADFEDRGPGSFGRWLARVVELKTREAVRRYRGTQKRAAAGEVSRGRRDDTGNHPGLEPTPSQAAMAGELRDRVAHALAGLPPNFAEVIHLVRGEGLSMAEAAARMGRTRAAVKQLFSRALARLARDLRLEHDRGA